MLLGTWVSHLQPRTRIVPSCPDQSGIDGFKPIASQSPCLFACDLIVTLLIFYTIVIPPSKISQV